MTEVHLSPPSSTPSHFTQPADGAVGAPRPGEGGYLTGGSRNRGTRTRGTRGAPGAHRGSDRRAGSVNEIPLPPTLPPRDSHDLYSMYSGPSGGFQPADKPREHSGGGPSMALPSISHNHRSGSSSLGVQIAPPSADAFRNAPVAGVHPVVQPRAEAARRGDMGMNGLHFDTGDHGRQGRLGPPANIAVRQSAGTAATPSATPHHTSQISDDGPGQLPSARANGVEKRGGRPPRGSGRATPGGDAARDRPAHLDRTPRTRDSSAHREPIPSTKNLKATAPAFTPQLPIDTFSRMAITNDQSPASSPVAGSSRASSGQGRPRTGDNGTRARNQPRERSEKTSQPQQEVGQSSEAPVEAVAMPTPSGPRSSRRAAFEQQTKLTTAGDRVEAAQKSKQDDTASDGVAEKVTRPPVHKRKEEKDDLISRLTRGLGKRPYVECPICFNSITPSQPIFCCLPPTAPPPPNLDDDAPTNYYQACYTPFHLSCIRDWADRSLAEESEKIRTNQLVENDGKVKRPEWRCPGCQKRRVDRVGLYKCFCGRVTSPTTNQTLPHSCAEPCSRPRPLCSHPCTLPCHPGPCPPCQVALIVPCPSHHSSLTVKCAAATAGANMTPVCDEICGRERGCGDRSHTCQLLCHFGPCAPCTESEEVRCYCGADNRTETCGWRKDDEMQCAKAPESGVEEHWKGRWCCGRPCNEAFDCGIHTCEETCHPHPLFPLPCPNSPSQVLTCPCAQTPLSLLCEPEGPEPARTKCTDPVPTCTLPCPRARPCGHQCPLPCHHGDCPPCHQDVVRPCRCGESVFSVRCEEFGERVRRGDGEMRCERVCKALRNCGRHECSRICCPLSYKAKSSRIKKKAGAAGDLQDLVAPGEEDLHACSLTCGKWLSCGLHTCQRKDHRGACGRCLQASYDELICHCGESIIYPPVACGTTINCAYPCARPPPTCGHPKTTHSCHESPSCPPCPYLTTRPCACGKDPSVKNVRCSQSIVSCGQTCGNLLSCGYHRCDKTCHKQGEGECGECTQVCGKPKRVCRHPCTSVCHAPAKCPESDPCGAIVDQKCACGNLSNRTTCGASAIGTGTKGESREMVQLKCNSECLVKQRNARLAEALGIKGAETRSGSGDATEWSAELKAFAQGNWAFVKMVESALADFWKSGKPSHILPQMPAAKRTFVLSLAQVYRLATDLLDAEPNRSIMIRRKIDTRLPNPLLSTVVTPPHGTLGNGEKKTGLANLRPTTTTSGGSWGKVLAPTPKTASPWGSSAVSGASTPSTYSTPMGSRAISPAIKPSRPVTPATEGAAHTSATMTVPVNQSAQIGGVGLGLARTRSGSARQGIVGEVGKVEEDDWDVDA